MSEKKKHFIQILVPLGLICIGFLGFITLTASKTPPQKRIPDIPLPVVQAMEVILSTQPIIIRGQGTVRPLREIQLVSQVGGKVVYTSTDLVDGGSFQKGDILLKIEPLDYELAVTLAESQVKDAESKLKFASEEAAVAREEWREHYAENKDGVREPTPLVLKEPQLKAAEARLEAERANLKKAKLNLERTVLKAPFSGVVSGKNVDIGQYIIPGQALAELFSTEAVEIMVPLEDKDLLWFHVPGLTPGEWKGSKSVIRAEIVGHELSWEGEVARAEGKIDERTRMVNVIVRVENPYEKKPPLAVGLFVQVAIQGQLLKKAAVIPRSAMHTDNSVWIVTVEKQLDFRSVDVARFTGDQAIIQGGLQQGEWVVVSQLETPTNGMKVQILNEKSERAL